MIFYHRIVSVIFFFLLSSFVFAEDKGLNTVNRDGQALAAELRNAAPEENSEVRGVLKIRSRKRGVTNDIPVICKVVAGKGFWETIYETAQTSKNGSEKLIVRHFSDKPNDYFYARAAKPTDALPEPAKISASQANSSLAGSDFWLTDLGLDFLHWPQQRRIKGEMRLGQACHVLESVNPKAAGVRRVKSWIDKDTGGILIAEAYDGNDKQVKEFSLSGSSFKKVNGRWQLEKMEIRNLKTDSKTVLQFDLPKE